VKTTGVKAASERAFGFFREECRCSGADRTVRVGRASQGVSVVEGVLVRRSRSPSWGCGRSGLDPTGRRALEVRRPGTATGRQRFGRITGIEGRNAPVYSEAGSPKRVVPYETGRLIGQSERVSARSVSSVAARDVVARL